MPLDSKGKFRSSTQRAIAADRGASESGAKMPMAKPMAKPMPAMAPVPEQEEGAGFTIYPNGDGTFYSVSADGERTDHPSAGHAAAHFMAQNGVGGPRGDIDVEELGAALQRFYEEEEGETY